MSIQKLQPVLSEPPLTCLCCGEELPTRMGPGRRREKCDSCLYKARLIRARASSKERHQRLREKQ